MEIYQIDRAISACEKQIKILERLRDRTKTLANVERNMQMYSNPNSVYYGMVSLRIKDERRIEMLKGQIEVLKSGLFATYRTAITHEEISQA